MRPISRPTSALALLLLGIALAAWAGSARRGPALPAPGSAPGVSEHSAVVLPASEACLDAGYLCTGIEHADSFRVLRWPDGVRSLRVAVPEPALADPRHARDLQQAAIRGILAWQNAPLRLVVNDRAAGEADIVVSWTDSVGGTRLGETRVEWREEGGRVTFKVPRLLLGTTSTVTGRALAPSDLELVAVHEMGHALGLPHSDSRGDVMYPEKTARFLTARDHRTVRALYDLPTGALVRRQP